MMAEHPPLLDTTSIISSEIPLLTSPIVSGDGAQQVILVQVNPGEAFTIRREDGQFQCITDMQQSVLHLKAVYYPNEGKEEETEDNQGHYI